MPNLAQSTRPELRWRVMSLPGDIPSCSTEVISSYKMPSTTYTAESHLPYFLDKYHNTAFNFESNVFVAGYLWYTPSRKRNLTIVL